jgi:tRNA(Ile)-lysidine synthase TilS/MesJ
MNSNYNINGKTFNTFDVFRPIATGEKIAILYSGGSNSHLLALIAKEIYGIENIVFVLNSTDEFINIENNEKKTTKITNSFNSALQKLGAVNILNISSGLSEPHRMIYDLIVEKINNEYDNVKFIFGGYNNKHRETIQLLWDSGWDKGLISFYQLYDYLNTNSEKYPELYYYVKNFDNNYWAAENVWGFEQVNYYYQSVKKPFENLKKIDIIKFYQIVGLEDKIFDSTCCSVLTTKSHCGYCNACLERKYSLLQMNVEDKTDYN